MHVVEEGQEILRASLYGRRMLSLPGTERAIEQQIHLADQFIHGRQDFMAHDRQKLFFLTERCRGIVLRQILHSFRNSLSNVFLKTVVRFAQFRRSLAHAGREAFNLQIDGVVPDSISS